MLYRKIRDFASISQTQAVSTAQTEGLSAYWSASCCPWRWWLQVRAKQQELGCHGWNTRIIIAGKKMNGTLVLKTQRKIFIFVQKVYWIARCINVCKHKAEKKDPSCRSFAGEVPFMEAKGKTVYCLFSSLCGGFWGRAQEGDRAKWVGLSDIWPCHHPPSSSCRHWAPLLLPSRLGPHSTDVWLVRKNEISPDKWSLDVCVGVFKVQRDYVIIAVFNLDMSSLLLF